MVIKLPGQLRGPECRSVVTQLVNLRKNLEPIFQDYDYESLQEIAIVFRIDGSLGSFGKDGIENIKLSSGSIECDAVVKDHGWADLNESEIREILKPVLLQAIEVCFKYASIKYDANKITAALD